MQKKGAASDKGPHANVLKTGQSHRCDRRATENTSAREDSRLVDSARRGRRNSTPWGRWCCAQWTSSWHHLQSPHPWARERSPRAASPAPVWTLRQRGWPPRRTLTREYMPGELSDIRRASQSLQRSRAECRTRDGADDAAQSQRTQKPREKTARASRTTWPSKACTDPEQTHQRDHAGQEAHKAIEGAN